MMIVVDELEDFLLQMELAVLEETPLYEISMGSIDLVTPPVTHGPWPAASCAAVLRRWHKAGWITLGKGTIAIRDLAAIERVAKLGPPLR